MAVPPLNVNDALSQFQQIPAVAQLYEESERPHVERLLNITKGKLLPNFGGVPGFRIYAAAARYIGSHPELRFVRRHDNTEVGDVAALIASLESTQADEDADYFEPVPSGAFKSPLFRTVSVRGYAEP
ncbi:hypothetical protein NIES4073_02670 (plasmid) [Kalymmatonema gypsitolerans NIES-4073]|nr:hypothetical protein [Brasilonema octagenarum HA4186-MV1]BAZ19397.1 hypothetical protein NIES4073_02670 [Scytonema sp. NIES-4073]